MKNFFQILVLCFFCFQFNTAYSQECCGCFELAEDFAVNIPGHPGMCDNISSQQLRDAVSNYQNIVSNSDGEGCDAELNYAGYSMIHNLINQMSFLNSCYGECGSDWCTLFVGQVNTLLQCMEGCGSSFTDDLCTSVGYLECSCDCECDNPWEVDCHNDEIDPVLDCTNGQNLCCDQITISGSKVGVNFFGCCVFNFEVNTPSGCCPYGIGNIRHFGLDDCIPPIIEYGPDNLTATVTVCCDNPNGNDAWVQAEIYAPCNDVESDRIQYFPCQ